MNLYYTEQAYTDIDFAIGWYEAQKPGLGFEFLECLRKTANRIIENPRLYSVQHERLRGALTRRFPFTIFYTIEKSGIVVHAVFDNRQDPGKKP